MDIAIAPYHHERKMIKEGLRGRDGHFLETLAKSNVIDNVLIIDRPTTLVEIMFGKFRPKLEGELLLKSGSFELLKKAEGLYVIDFVSKRWLSQIMKRHIWFFDIYQEKKYQLFIQVCVKFLNLDIALFFNQNIYAAPLNHLFNQSVFDAWDNWIQFPAFKKYETYLVKAYQEHADTCAFWITNAETNIDFFNQRFQPAAIHLIPNGAEEAKFKNRLEPEELKSIKRPIVGFGGKISHLVDAEWVNILSKNHPNKSIVLVGAVFDKSVRNEIIERENVFFLGDKSYDVYPDYVAHFDVGIVPHGIGERETGGDSIKAYEYMAAGIPVVSSSANRANRLAQYLYIANSPQEFSDLVDVALKNGAKCEGLPKEFSWGSRANHLLELAKQHRTDEK